MSFYQSCLQRLSLFLCCLFISLSRVQLFVTPWTAWGQASLSVTNSLSLLKLITVKLVMPSNHLLLYRPLLLPSVFPSIRVFSNESVLHIRWPKYWSFSFSIRPSNEYSALISFRMDWFDLRDFFIAQMVKNLPAIQETRVRSLGQEDPLEKEMTTHSSISPREFHGQESLAGYCPRGHKESDMTKQLTHGWISLQSRGLSRGFSSTAAQKHQFFGP